MPKYLVTGGGGFLGSAIVRRLLRDGGEVLSLSRGRYPKLEEWGAVCVQVDLSTPVEEWHHLFDGIDTVFHVAAKVEMWGEYSDFFAANVTATKSIIEACQRHDVPRLVFTSSPSVIANGENLKGVDESRPYPKHFEAFYPETKAIAEQEVLSNNGKRGLSTVALRPHLIFGPGDTNLAPTVLEKAKSGRLKIIGDGKNLSDFTYIDDCVEAHILAMHALRENSEARGRAFFISQGDPVPLWEWINTLLELHHQPPVVKKVSVLLAQAIAGIGEFICSKLPRKPEPPLTRFLVSEMYTDHYFSIERARKVLGYRPTVKVRDALIRTYKGSDQSVKDSREII